MQLLCRLVFLTICGTISGLASGCSAAQEGTESAYELREGAVATDRGKSPCGPSESAKISALAAELETVRPALEASWTSLWASEGIIQLHFLFEQTVRNQRRGLSSDDQCFAVGFNLWERLPWSGAPEATLVIARDQGESVTGCNAIQPAVDDVGKPVACADAIRLALEVADRRSQIPQQGISTPVIRGAALAYDGCNGQVVYSPGTIDSNRLR